jgi:hypothetical protein
MNESNIAIEKSIAARHIAIPQRNAEPETRVGMANEILPFTVRPVQTEADLMRAVNLRHLAYARHKPEFAEKLREPEADDLESDSIILLAESKLDGSAIGTMRIQNNEYRPLSMEHAVTLPDFLKSTSLVEVRRLGVANGLAGRLVKMVLIKACLLYCAENNIKWAVVAARAPLDRSYQNLLFEDVLPGQTFTPLPVANNDPHSVMAFEIDTIEERFTKHQHPLLNFFCKTNHPDIHLSLATENDSFLSNRENKPQFALN